MAGTKGLLTIIITTSVTPTAPSTELISTALESFRTFCPDLLACNIIVVLDGYDEVQCNSRLKKGRVTPKQAENYDVYKANVKGLILSNYGKPESSEVFTRIEGEAEFGRVVSGQNAVKFTAEVSPDKRMTFIEPCRRIGFGLAVRTALRMTDTPYVWVHQHDWVLTTDIPLGPLLDVMGASGAEPERPIEYVCLPSARNLSYATCADVAEYPTLTALTLSLKGDFSSQLYPAAKIPLTPLFFWFDKPHIASTAHYLDKVFRTRLAMMRGDFIEDKIGQISRAQMKEGLWSKWATWLYYPDEGQTTCVRHLHGRVWIGKEAEDKKIAEFKLQQRDPTSKPEPKPEPIYDTAIIQSDSDA